MLMWRGYSLIFRIRLACAYPHKISPVTSMTPADLRLNADFSKLSPFLPETPVDANASLGPFLNFTQLQRKTTAYLLFRKEHLRL